MLENIYNILGTVCVVLALMFLIFLNVVDQIKKFSEVKKIKCALVTFFAIGILIVILIILKAIIQESLLTSHTIIFFIPLMILSYCIMFCRKMLKDQKSIDDKTGETKKQ